MLDLVKKAYKSFTERRNRTVNLNPHVLPVNRGSFCNVISMKNLEVVVLQ